MPLDDHVADHVAQPPFGLLRPGMRMAEPLQPDRHQVAVFVENAGLAVAGGLLGLRRHPVDAVGREPVDVVLPAPGIEAFGLAVQELLDRVLQFRRDLGRAQRRIVRAGERLGRGDGQHGQFPAVM